MPTPVSVARQCLTVEAAHALDEAVIVARKRGHAQTTSLHAVSALLSLPASILRDACARVRNAAYSPRLQFRALELCLGVSLDRIQSGQPAGGGSDDPDPDPDPPVSNSLMAAIKRSQAHQRRLPENFRLHHDQNQNGAVSCVKVELRQLILSILDDPVVSRVFGEAGFRSSELKLSIIRPIPHVLRYPRPRGPLFLCNIKENPNPDPGTGSGLYPVRRGFNLPYRNFAGFIQEDESHRRIGAVFAREKGRNPLLMGVSAYGALIDFVHLIEKRIDGILPKELTGLNVISIGADISDQISDKFDRKYTDTRFHELGKLIEQASGPGLVLNFGDLRVFTDSNDCDKVGLSGGSADYIVCRLSELLQRYGRRLWLIGAAASDEVYYKFVRRFPCVEKDWDLQVLTITSLRPCLAEKPYTKSSLMESFVPFGGFFSSASELKLHFSGSAKFPAQGYVYKSNHSDKFTGLPNARPVSSVSDHHQSSLPSWLRMTTRTDLDPGFGSTAKEGPESGGRLMSPSNFSASTGSTKSVTTDLGLGISSVSTGTDHDKPVDENLIEMGNNKDISGSQCSSSSCLDNPSDFNSNSFKIIFKTLTDRVSWQDEAARVISCTISQQQNAGTRRDLWFNLAGPDAIGKRKIAIAVAEVMYQSEQQFMAFDLGVALEMNGCDNLVSFRGKTMADYIFEGLCQNPLRVLFLENLEKADEQLQRNLSTAIRTGKFGDSHGREIGIGNTTFVTTMSSSEHSGTIKSSVYYSEENILRAKERQMEILIEISSCFPFARSVSSPSSTNKRRLIGWEKTQEKSVITEITKQTNRTATGVLDLNLPAKEIEIEDTNCSNENSKLWLQNFTNHTRLVHIPMKPFDFDGLAERIEKGINETFRKCVGSDCLLEIDPRIMERLLAAVCFSDANRVLKDWMEKTLTGVFKEVRERYDITPSSAVKLVGRDLGIIQGDRTQIDGILPCKIALI